MGNRQTVPTMPEDVEVKHEVQKLKKELKKQKRNDKIIAREQETEGENQKSKNKKKTKNIKKIGRQ